MAAQRSAEGLGRTDGRDGGAGRGTASAFWFVLSVRIRSAQWRPSLHGTPAVSAVCCVAAAAAAARTRWELRREERGRDRNELVLRCERSRSKCPFRSDPIRSDLQLLSDLTASPAAAGNWSQPPRSTETPRHCSHPHAPVNNISEKLRPRAPARLGLHLLCYVCTYGNNELLWLWSACCLLLQKMIWR